MNVFFCFVCVEVSVAIIGWNERIDWSSVEYFFIHLEHLHTNPNRVD